MSAKKLKAYEVREDDEGNCVIAFATNSATARRDGGNELNLSFEEVESCTRKPEFDVYAPGPVPLHATLENGWWHECGHCFVRFDKDGRHGEDEDDRDDEFGPVEDGQRRSYCCTACMMKEWAERRETKSREHAVIEACATRWPQATQIRAHQKYYDRSTTCWASNFALPGLENHVEQFLGDNVVSVNRADVDVFMELYGVRP